MTRTILHLDLDAFFCAVEERMNPALAGKPFAVGGRPDERGVVASCSYAARQFGVRSAMPMTRAMRICPGLIIVASRHGVYGKASEEVMARLRHLTPLVEQISIDEAFVDVSDLTEGGEAIARQLQAQIAAELHLPCSLGIASNKLVAKIATDVGKTANRGSGPPNAITSVPPGDEAAFLAPQPVEMLWGVGPKTAERLAERGVYTIGQLAAYPELELAYLFGANGHDLARRARGIDNRPIETSHDVKSISSETTFARDVADAAILQQTLRELTESVGRRLRGEHLSGTTVKLKLRWADFTTLTRQERLKQPTDLDDEILHSARRLLAKTWQPPRLVRLIGVGVSGLQPLVRQLSLWDAAGEKERRLHTAVEELRSRFGDGVVQRGSKLDDRR